MAMLIVAKSPYKLKRMVSAASAEQSQRAATVCDREDRKPYFMCSFVPRPFTPLVFDCLQYAKTEGGVSYHVIRGTHDVTDSRRKDLFTSSYGEARETRQVPAERPTSRAYPSLKQPLFRYIS